jgi:hypothetical protein
MFFSRCPTAGIAIFAKYINRAVKKLAGNQPGKARKLLLVSFKYYYGKNE